MMSKLCYAYVKGYMYIYIKIISIVIKMGKNLAQGRRHQLRCPPSLSEYLGSTLDSGSGLQLPINADPGRKAGGSSTESLPSRQETWTEFLDPILSLPVTAGD